jgi:hypothetical protein
LEGRLGSRALPNLSVSFGRSRASPDPTALSLAKELPDRFTSLVPTIQIGLLEHHAPYKEAVDAANTLPALAQALRVPMQYGHT